MATRNSNNTGGGLWSAIGTWDTGVPLDGDIVNILGTDNVTFDVDQSAFATGIQLSVATSATITCSTATGFNRHLALGVGNTSGTGYIIAGTTGTPLPTTITFTIATIGACQITNTSNRCISQSSPNFIFSSG